MSDEIQSAPESAPDKPKFDPREKRSIYDIIQDLSKPIPGKYLKTRKQGGKDITYIPWHNATKLLDYYANGWCYRVKEIMNISPRVAMTVELSIPCLEGVVCREATGSEKEDKDGYGDPYSNSESMALRRAAAKFGLGRDLYDGEDHGAPRQENRPQGQGNRQNAPRQNTPPPARNNPPAQNQSGGKMASDAQIKFLLNLSTELDITEVDICDRFTDGEQLTFDGLTVAQAVEAINWLKEIKETKGGAK